MNQLKVYLTVNSIFSALTGITMLVFSNGLDSIFGINNANIFPVIGLNLILFSAFVWFVSRKHLTNKLLIHIISGLDALWVLGSISIIVFPLFKLSITGYIIIGIVAVWIGFLGFMQIINNK